MQDKQLVELDICGQTCPSCLLRTLKAVNEHQQAIRAGTCEVVVTTDDRRATTTIPATVAKMGYDADVTVEATGYRIRVYTPASGGSAHGNAA